MFNLNKFQINPTNEFHILRHFKYVDESYKNTIIGQPYWYYDYNEGKFLTSIISKNDVEYALETVGTKFDKILVSMKNPKELLESIKEKIIELDSKNSIRWIYEEGNKRSVFSFTFRHISNVGVMNCLPMSKFTDDEKKNIKPVLRSKCIGENSIIVNTVSEKELLSTDMVYVEVVDIEQLPFFVMTAFPDCSALNDYNIDSKDEVVFAI